MILSFNDMNILKFNVFNNFKRRAASFHFDFDHSKQSKALHTFSKNNNIFKTQPL